uniref:Uncharacterized protein n=1 Tax=Acrobeloides nanus TaxID=290746 RepID=A0A914D7D6_9BILA
MSSSDPSSSAREATIAVLRDTGSKVILSIKVPGLQRRHSIIKAILNYFRKASDPFRLSSNAIFKNYSLTENGLDFSVDVYESKQARKQRSEIKQEYFLKIAQFPSKINSDSAEFELVEGESGDCYFLLTCIKLDNLRENWKDYLATHGTLDKSRL